MIALFVFCGLIPLTILFFIIVLLVKAIKLLDRKLKSEDISM